MKPSEDVLTCFTVLSVLCACATAFNFKRNSNTRDIDTIVKELRRELQLRLGKDNTGNDDLYKIAQLSLPEVQDLDRFRSQQTFPDVPAITGSQSDKSGNSLLDILSRKDNSGDDHDVNKRQGGWDYDYGLGGGRFGKRSGMFADYSLGGGRFGRDVSHVQNLEEDENVDFEDV